MYVCMYVCMVYVVPPPANHVSDYIPTVPTPLHTPFVQSAATDAGLPS